MRRSRSKPATRRSGPARSPSWPDQAALRLERRRSFLILLGLAAPELHAVLRRDDCRLHTRLGLSGLVQVDDAGHARAFSNARRAASRPVVRSRKPASAGVSGIAFCIRTAKLSPPATSRSAAVNVSPVR